MKNKTMLEMAEDIREKFDSLISLLSSEDALNQKLSQFHTGNKEKMLWSKTNAFSIVPFYNELTGFKTGEMQHKEPKNKKNVYCYFMDEDSGEINKVISYNSKGNVEDTSYIIREGNSSIEVRQDFRGDFIALSQTFFDGNKCPLSSYFASEDGNVSGYYYFYKNDKINEILAVSKNSPLPYVTLLCEYDENGIIKKIYFNKKEAQVVVYPR
ncbi:hypothetical protein ACMGGR_18185 [Erwinia sp. BNK-24-b]|uniref:hypothetical protein n=1 Tax=Erwinia TaxID=551 RepID=UPI001FEFFE57|nr:hypothetical protein [Erwinia phyllosphaerae]